MLHGLGLGDIAPAFADDHAEFDLPVGALAAARNLDRIVRPDDGAGPLGKDHRLGGHGLARLGAVVGGGLTGAAWPTQAPGRRSGCAPPGTSGNEAASSRAMRARPAGVSVWPAMSGTTADRSRTRPCASSKPGFSMPLGP